MEPATATAIAAVASASASIYGGVQANKAAKLEAAQYEDARETARVAALQDEVQKREQLQRVLGTRQAIRAGRGLDLYSGSAKAGTKEVIRQAERDILTAQVNYLSQQRKFGLGASGARAAGTGALVSGFGKAAGSVLGSGLLTKSGANPISTGYGGGGDSYDPSGRW